MYVHEETYMYKCGLVDKENTMAECGGSLCGGMF